MKVMGIPIVISKLSTVTKGLVQGLEDLEIRGRMETIQTTTLLRSARILRRILETWSHSNSSRKPSANVGVKKKKPSQMSKIIIRKWWIKHNRVNKLINHKTDLITQYKLDHPSQNAPQNSIKE